MKTQPAISLQGDLVFQNVAATLENVSHRLKLQGDVSIDLSKVERVDSAGLALLLELSRRGHAAGASVQYVGVPASLAALAGFFEVAVALGIA